MIRLPVNEVFDTVQGEATWTGTPALFIRLQGCGVGCPWCDTKHTWEQNPADEIDFNMMVAKTGDSPRFAWATVHQLAEYATNRSRHVVITGGEPCMFDLRLLTDVLWRAGKTVQVETSGTEPVSVHNETWVTLSPKIGMPGGKVINRDAWHRANEIKMPVGKQADIDCLANMLYNDQPVGANANCSSRWSGVWLQPLSQSAKATALCVEAARLHGWRISIQTHKFMGVR